MLASMTSTDSRLAALRRLLSEGELSTQDELRAQLASQKFKVTQSTISRDLRRLGAVKAIDANGQTVYRLPEEGAAPVVAARRLADMLLDIEHNGSIIVMHTTPGSASLIARHLDQVRPGGILGTIAGDDTIFVAPAAGKSLKSVCEIILQSMQDG